MRRFLFFFLAIVLLSAGIGSQHVRRRAVYPSASFSPADIAGMVFWLKADGITGAVNGDAIATWTDSSGNANDATQATSTKRPLYRTGVLSVPVLEFDDDDFLLTPSLAWFPSKRGTVVAVYANRKASSYGTVLATWDTATTPFQWDSAVSGTAFKFYAGSGGTQVASSLETQDVFLIEALRRTGDTTLERYKNGSLVDTFTIANNQPSTNVAGICATTSGGETMKSYIACVIYYDNSISSGDLTALYSYLNSTYGIY